jgi:hypothetical protein
MSDVKRNAKKLTRKALKRIKGGAIGTHGGGPPGKSNKKI